MTKILKIKTYLAIALLMNMYIGASAAPMELPGHLYGRAVLPVLESLGNSVNRIKKQGNTFEPLNQLRKDDPIRKMSRAIGRLDLLVEKAGRQIVTTCTVTVVQRDLVLTNYHCLPGINGKVLKASILLDYFYADGRGAKRINIKLPSVEKNQKLDYALARLAKPAPEDITPLPIVPKRILPHARLMLIHHPAGQVKMMSRFLCKSARTTPDKGPFLRHVCDTLPGSSGGIIFDASLQAIALHHTGGLNGNDPDSFNTATLMAAMVYNRATFLQLPGSQPSTTVAAGISALKAQAQNKLTQDKPKGQPTSKSSSGHSLAAPSPRQEKSPLEKNLDTINQMLH